MNCPKCDRCGLVLCICSLHPSDMPEPGVNPHGVRIKTKPEDLICDHKGPMGCPTCNPSGRLPEVAPSELNADDMRFLQRVSDEYAQSKKPWHKNVGDKIRALDGVAARNTSEEPAQPSSDEARDAAAQEFMNTAFHPTHKANASIVFRTFKAGWDAALKWRDGK